MRAMKIFAGVLAVSTAYALFGDPTPTPREAGITPVTILEANTLSQPEFRVDVYVPAEGYGSDSVDTDSLYVAQIPYTAGDPVKLFVAVPDESPEGGYPEKVYEDGSTIYTDGWVLDPDGPTWKPPTFDPTRSDIELGA